MSNVNEGRSIGYTGKYDPMPKKAAEVTAKAFMEMYDADKSGDLTREELSVGGYEFDKASFSRIAKDDKLTPDEIKAYSEKSVLPGDLAEMAEGYAGWVRQDQKKLDDYKGESLLQKVGQWWKDAKDFGFGYSREKNLKENLEFTRSHAARMLDEQLKQE